MVTQPVANHVHKKINMDWEEFKKRARLCPECRRKRTAESMAFVDAKRRE
jgi:hypothetical protein